MTTDHFILALAAYLGEAGVALPITAAARYVLAHEGVETDTTPQDAAQEFVCSADRITFWDAVRQPDSDAA